MRPLRGARWAACIVAVAGANAGCSDAPVTTRPNIVLITLDTTRADHLGLFGYFRDTSPHLDRFAEQSIVFDRAIVPMATTLPTHVSILTATYPIEHGVLANLTHGGRRFVPAAGLRSFASYCADAGYDTAAFVSATPLNRGSGAEAGFTVYDEAAAPATQRRGDVTTNAAVRWIRGPADSPFFLWVHYYDAHWPLMPSRHFKEMFQNDGSEQELEAWMSARRFLTETVRTGVGPENVRTTLNRYDAALRFQDASVGRLLAALSARDDWDRTAVVIVGDHGEGLSQHGHAAHGGTWDEQIHAPLVLRVSGQTPRRISRPVSIVDALPTLLALLDAPGFEEFLEQAAGRDALALDAGERAVFSQDTGRLARRPGYRFALTGPRWKYLRIEEPKKGGPREMLFDLDADPFELNNVLAENEGIARELEADLLARLTAQRERGAQLRGGAEPESRPEDPDVVERLRALGYVDDSEPTDAPP